MSKRKSRRPRPRTGTTNVRALSLDEQIALDVPEAAEKQVRLLGDLIDVLTAAGLPVWLCAGSHYKDDPDFGAGGGLFVYPGQAPTDDLNGPRIKWSCADAFEGTDSSYTAIQAAMTGAVSVVLEHAGYATHVRSWRHAEGFDETDLLVVDRLRPTESLNDADTDQPASVGTSAVGETVSG